MAGLLTQQSVEVLITSTIIPPNARIGSYVIECIIILPTDSPEPEPEPEPEPTPNPTGRTFTVFIIRRQH